MFGLRAVSCALDKMNARHGRKALQFFHGELQRTIHHPMDQESMLPGIDVRNYGAAVSADKMERGRCDNPHRILEWTQHMKCKPEHVRRRPLGDSHAHRGHEM